MNLICCSLADLIAIAGEDSAKKALSSFCVSKDKELENWIRNNAFSYEKSHNARTFLFVTDDLEVVALFSLALNVFPVPEKYSRSLRNKITGFGRFTHDNVPCFLLGQFARHDSYSKEDISGKEMLLYVIDKIRDARKIAGGRFLMLDCGDHMVSYYEGLGFKFVDKAADKDGLNQMVLFL